MKKISLLAYLRLSLFTVKLFARGQNAFFDALKQLIFPHCNYTLKPWNGLLSIQFSCERNMRRKRLKLPTVSMQIRSYFSIQYMKMFKRFASIFKKFIFQKWISNVLKIAKHGVKNDNHLATYSLKWRTLFG